MSVNMWCTEETVSFRRNNLGRKKTTRESGSCVQNRNHFYDRFGENTRCFTHYIDNFIVWQFNWTSFVSLYDLAQISSVML